jgi:hypothetical protein
MLNLPMLRAPIFVVAFFLIGCSVLKTPPQTFTSPEAAL